jgi:NAD(P)-dependent dehydrogenase (short-subunit alcohol dehydrogenase family)
MDRALVIGASGGIGAAVAAELAGRGCAVTGLSRSGDGLDVTDEASIVAALGSLAGPYDLVLVVTGALVIDGVGPEKSLRALDAGALAAQFALNAAGPALVLKHALRLMPRDRRSVFAALSARVGSIGDNALGGWYGYRASKAALNQLMRTGAIEVARTHRHAVVATLHPGTVATALTASHSGGHPAVAPAEAARNLLAVIEGLTPAQSGQFFDWAGQPIPW